MSGAKPWQLVLIVVAVLAAGASVFYSCSMLAPPVKSATYATMVDVNTGDLFQDKYPKKRMVTYPQKRPGTNTLSLYPAHKIDGKWKLETRYFPLIKADKSLQPVAIADWHSGELKVTGDKPTAADIFEK